jgi:Lon protease-like protein
MRVDRKLIDLPVFPLPNAVLFPGTSILLNVFNERYRKLLEEVYERGGDLAIALAIPSREGTGFDLSPVGSAGKIKTFHKFPDGHLELLVEGERRVRLCTLIQLQPYLVMETQDLESADEKTAWPKVLGRLQDLARAWVFLHPSFEDQSALMLDDFPTLGALCDFFVFHFIKRVREKQLYLDCVDPLERAERLANFLERDLERLSRQAMKRSRAKLTQLH